jgi:hypothetical protein
VPISASSTERTCPSRASPGSDPPAG